MMKRLHGRFVVFAARCLPGSMLEQLLMHAHAALLAPHSARVVFRCALPAYPFSVTRNHTHRAREGWRERIAAWNQSVAWKTSS